MSHIFLLDTGALKTTGGDFAFPAGCSRRPCPADDLYPTFQNSLGRLYQAKRNRIGGRTIRVADVGATGQYIDQVSMDAFLLINGIYEQQRESDDTKRWHIGPSP